MGLETAKQPQQRKAADLRDRAMPAAAQSPFHRKNETAPPFVVTEPPAPPFVVTDPPADPPPAVRPAPDPPPLTPPTVPAAHPLFATPVRYQAIPRPDDDERATAETIGIMADMVRQDSQSPIVRQAARAAAAGINGADARRLIESVFWWIRRHVALTQDSDIAQGIAGLSSTPEETEVLIRPADLLAMPQPAGDCDDHSMLAAAMLTALGIPAALRTIAADPADPSRYSHVYVMAQTPQGYIAVDASHGPRPAWEAPAVGKSTTWELRPLRQPLALGDWNTTIQDVVKTSATAAWDLARIRSTPTGYYQTTGPAGQTVYMQQPGAGPLAFPTAQLTSGGSGTMLLIVGGLGLGMMLLFAMSRGGR